MSRSPHGPPCHARGVTDGVELVPLLRLAFDELGLRRVVARIDERNEASANVARRLGMRLEAHLVENECFKGEWVGELDFAILDREWRARHAPA